MQTLNQRLQKGETGAFVELYDQLGEKLYRYAFAQIGSSQDASDIVQETFVRLVKSHRTLGRAENINGYVFATARNEIVRWLRTKKRDHSPNQACGNRHGETPFDQESFEQQIDGEDWVRHTLARLEPMDREIVQLKIFSQLTFQEIAAATQMQMANVTTRYRRAIAKLEACLSTPGPEPDHQK